MQYVENLVEGNLKSMADMLKTAISQGDITLDDIRLALEAEAKPLEPGRSVHELTFDSHDLLSKVTKSPDRDVSHILKKILKSTKYAVFTYRNIAAKPQMVRRTAGPATVPALKPAPEVPSVASPLKAKVTKKKNV